MDKRMTQSVTPPMFYSEGPSKGRLNTDPAYLLINFLETRFFMRKFFHIPSSSISLWLNSKLFFLQHSLPNILFFLVWGLANFLHFKKPNSLNSIKFRKQRNYFKKERVKNQKLHVSWKRKTNSTSYLIKTYIKCYIFKTSYKDT